MAFPHISRAKTPYTPTKLSNLEVGEFFTIDPPYGGLYAVVSNANGAVYVARLLTEEKKGLYSSLKETWESGKLVYKVRANITWELEEHYE